MQNAISRRTFLSRFGLGSAMLVLAACQAAPSPQSTGSQTKSAPTADKTPQPLTLPIVKSPLTLSYWCALDANVAATLNNMADMACYQELEKRSGIHLQFTHPPQGQTNEQFNLLVASGKYPDVIEVIWTNYAGGPAKALQDNVIIRLNDLVDQYAPNLKQVLIDHPDWHRQLITDEGDLYCFPFIRSDPLLQTSNGPAIRGDWLGRVGLQRPETMDDWHTALTAFKTQRPNGKQNILPFSSWWGAMALQAFNYLMFVGAWGVTMGFFRDQGTVKYGPAQPEFKEFITTMAGWYQEGLVDPDFPATDQSSFDAKVTGDMLGSSIQAGGRGIGKYMALMAQKDPTFKLVPTRYPSLQRGARAPLGQHDPNFYASGAAITSANQHVVETVKLLDYGYSREGSLLFNFGIEGQSYVLEQDGFPRFTPEVMRNPQGLPSAQALARYCRSVASGPFVQDPRYITQYYELPEQQEALNLWREPLNERHMPLVTPNQEETKRYARVMTDVTPRMTEVVTRVITGQEPLQTWDQLPAQLNQMGIGDAVKIQQAALERFNRRQVSA